MYLVEIGSGHKFFWLDEWTEVEALAKNFLIIFSLAGNKKAMVVESYSDTLGNDAWLVDLQETLLTGTRINMLIFSIIYLNVKDQMKPWMSRSGSLV